MLMAVLIVGISQAQPPVAQADAKSLELYNAENWKELIKYGKQQLASGIDFPLLRMRMGYAAYMTGNYSESLVQYAKVYKEDATNTTALYYLYLDNIYLNNRASARYYEGLLPQEKKDELGSTGFKLASLEVEYSGKFTGDTIRKPATYLRAGIGVQAGYKLELGVSGESYTQKILEPILRNLTVRPNINVNQKGFYGKASFAPTANIVLNGSYHFINTSFNGYINYTHIGTGTVSFIRPYAKFDAGISLGRASGKNFKQLDGTVTWYPFGNTKLYSISRAAYADSSLAFTQIAGIGLGKKAWFEGNITLGNYWNMLEKNGLYAYNDIDKKLFKAGGGVYLALSPKLMANVNYVFEQKQRYIFTNYLYYQHTINTSLSWKF